MAFHFGEARAGAYVLDGGLDPPRWKTVLSVLQKYCSPLGFGLMTPSS